MWTIYVAEHLRDHVDSEYVSYMAGDCNRTAAEFIGNQQIHSLTNTWLYTSVQIKTAALWTFQCFC